LKIIEDRAEFTRCNNDHESDLSADPINSSAPYKQKNRPVLFKKAPAGST